MDLSVVYATTTDYSQYSGVSIDTLPSNIEMMLKRASEKVTMTTHRNYDETNQSHINAAKYAVCAQVKYWIDNDIDYADESDIQSYSFANISVNYGNKPKRLMCDTSVQYLKSECLLYSGVKQR